MLVKKMASPVQPSIVETAMHRTTNPSKALDTTNVRMNPRLSTAIRHRRLNVSKFKSDT